MVLTYAKIQQSQHEKLIQQGLHFLDEVMQQRLQRFRRWQNIQASLLGRLLLRHSLKQNFGYDLQADSVAYSDYKKPYLHDTSLQFNVSHSHELVVCAVQHQYAVGVDIEYLRPISIANFRSQMTPNEWQHIQKKQQQLPAFYDYWTSKEAILKVVGAGLHIDLKSFEISPDRAGTYLNDQYWYLRHAVLQPGYCCYVSSASPIRQLLINEVSTFRIV